MKSIFDEGVPAELGARIQNLSPDSTALWGKMNVYQMIVHCILADEMYLGKKEYKRAFIGRIFGRMALQSILRDDKPMVHNATSHRLLMVTGNGDIASVKEKWVALVMEYEKYDGNGIHHWFFGKMTREQVGLFAYKHTDHHLRQFGC